MLVWGRVISSCFKREIVGACSGKYVNHQRRFLKEAPAKLQVQDWSRLRSKATDMPDLLVLSRDCGNILPM